MNKISKITALALMAVAVFTSACDKPPPEKSGGKELLIYCGITMILPMQEIARIIEKEQNCVIKITKGGSGNLLRSIKINQMGDLYLPGSDSYIKTAMADGLVVETVFVGYNQAALIVPKGNPRRITPDPANLAHEQYAVVIANPESGSIGRQTKKVLEKKGVWEEVSANVIYLTTDSKDITKAIKSGEADVGINWYATAFWPENRDYIQAIPFDPALSPRKKLLLGLLRFSRHPKIAERFMAYASGPKGREIFKAYGFLTENDLKRNP